MSGQQNKIKGHTLQTTAAPSLLSSLNLTATKAAGVVAVFVGCLVLVGWTLNIDILKRILPGLVAMNPTTAIAFVLAGVSLWLLRAQNMPLRLRRIAQGLALAVALTGLLKLLEILFGWDIGIDQLLFRHKLQSEAAVTGIPNRMAPNTALNFLLLGLALLLVDRQTRRGRWPTQYLVVVAVAASLLALIGYAYGVKPFYGISSYIPMALHTALTFIVLLVGLLCARPERGLMGLLTSDSAGGVMARRLLPAVIFIPTVLGWLRLQGERAGLYDAELGVALMVLSSVAILVAIVRWNASLLHRTDTERKQAKVELDHIFTLSPDLLGVAGLDGYFKRINPSFEETLGYTSQELLTNPFIEFVHPEDREATIREVEGLGAGAVTIRFENRYLRKDGSYVWLEWKAVPVVEEGLIYAAARDITERKRAEEERSRLAAIVESSDDAIIGKTLDGIITSWNRGAQRIYGYSPEEVVGKPINTLVPPEQLDEVPAILESVKQGKVVDHYETVRITKDARRLDVSIIVSPIKDPAGNVAGASTIARDITERKRAAEELQEAKEAADTANRAKSEFLSRMSHELRTPLNSILGFAQLLEMEDLAPEERESVNQILKAGRHLLGLINEVLDIARIEAGRLDLSMEPIQVGEVLQETLDLIRPLAVHRNVRLDNDPAETFDRHVLADRQRLKQVLLNLLYNAVKYNREEGTVTLSCEEVSRRRMLFRVSDTGPGIAPENMERLFVPFDRLEAEQTEVEGTGLGLALSKKLVELMGGEIRVQSTMGQGSTFWVELALAETQIEPHERMYDEEPQAGAQAPGKAGTVLYIEDNPSNLKLVQRILNQQRPEVELIPAMHGQLGLDLASEHRPDLILLDLHLPGMRGDEVLHQLRKEQATRRIPVVVVSADATPGQIERLLAAGAQAYLTKPIDVKEFLQVLDKTLADGEL